MDNRRALSTALHRLRSTLARIQGEAELLELRGTAVAGLKQGINEALDSLGELESIATISQQANLTMTSRVAIIDDDRRLAELTAERLRARGITAEAGSDLGLLDRVSSSALIVIDLSVLVRSAATDVERLRSHRFAIVSGDATLQAQSASQTFGAAIFLLKPVPMNRLLAWVETSEEGSA
jgi:CheY-like chemotaxis protein